MSEELKRDDQQVQVTVATPWGNRVQSYELHGNRVNAYDELSWNWSNFIAMPSNPAGLLADSVVWIGAVASITNVIRLASGVFTMAQIGFAAVLVFLPILFVMGMLLRVADGRVQMTLLMRVVHIVLGVLVSITVL